MLLPCTWILVFPKSLYGLRYSYWSSSHFIHIPTSREGKEKCLPFFKEPSSKLHTVSLFARVSLVKLGAIVSHVFMLEREMWELILQYIVGNVDYFEWSVLENKEQEQ